ncbi:hypothetical protein F4778DRAFT_698018 [Xylariomycetidae sp. FL2044]|nr:hypothetical protein F4778DRAFT_698018 [Xylariomycetidae sp. FL2044]
MAVIQRFRDLAEALEDGVTELAGLSFAIHDLRTLGELARRLSNAVIAIEKRSGPFRISSEEHGRRATEQFVHQAQSATTDVLTTGELRSPVLFKRNIILIFSGPENSFDSTSIASRKAATRRRCARIRQLSPDAIVSWAASFSPTTWRAGLMPNAVFENLLDDIEPNDTKAWPPAICEILQTLQQHPTIQRSPEYTRLVNSISDPSRHETVDDNATQMLVAARDPAHENRAMKHMFTDAPAANISLLPQPFRSAIRNSRLWRWERSQGYDSTSCLATLFPKDETQDVSVTIWCGHNDGYQLNDMFGVGRAVSA